jgi:hypothetical protein
LEPSQIPFIRKGLGVIIGLMKKCKIKTGSSWDKVLISRWRNAVEVVEDYVEKSDS